MKDLKSRLREMLSARLAPYVKARKKEETVRKSADKSKGFSFAKYIRGIQWGDWREAEAEHEVWAEAQKAIQTSGTGETGGYLIPIQYATELVMLLRAKAVIDLMGPTILRIPASNTVKIPKQTAGTTAYWVDSDDDTDIPESIVKAGMLDLVLKELAALVKCPNTLIQDSAPAADTLIRKDIVDAMALARDLAAINGPGGKQPLGLLNWPGIGSTSLTAAITVDALTTAMYTIEANNGTYSAWLMHPRSRNTVRSLKDLQNRPLWLENYSDKPEPPRLLGLPVHMSTQIPINLTVGGLTNTSPIVLGDWKEMVVAEKEGMSIDVSKEAGNSFARNQTWFRAITRVDIGIRQEKCFHIIKGVA